MKTLLRLSYLPPFALAAMCIAFAAGCGGGGTNPTTTTPTPTGEQNGWGEGQLTEGVRLKPTSVVALNLEPKGQTGSEDTGADGEDRIPYRLDKPTRLTVEMRPEDPMYITLIASQTGKLVLEVGPENPKVEMDLPAADYDLYVHSTSGESQAVFVQGREGTTRSPGSYNAALLATSGYCGSCDLRYARLYNMQIKRTDMRGANLTGAVIMDCDFEGTNFRGAIFTSTQVSETDMAGADFTGASAHNLRADNWNLAGANLSGVQFLGSSIRRTNLDGVNLKNAHFFKTTLIKSSAIGVDFSQSTIEESTFDTVQMPGATFTWRWVLGKPSRFTNCDMKGGDFSGLLQKTGSRGIVENCDLTGAKLAGLTVDSAFMQTNVLTNADLSNASLPAQINGAKLAGANLSGVKIAKARWENIDLTGADMTKQDVRDTFFVNCRMPGVRFDKVRMNNVDFDRCNLTDASFTGIVDMYHILFSGSDLTRADFTYAWLKANFQNSVMRNATMVQAYLNGTTYEGTDFSSANLRKTNFSGTADLGRNIFDGADLSGSIWDDGQRICAEGSIGACK